MKSSKNPNKIYIYWDKVIDKKELNSLSYILNEKWKDFILPEIYTIFSILNL